MGDSGDSNFDWEGGTSRLGMPYLIATKNSSDPRSPTTSEFGSQAEKKQPFETVVRWDIAKENKWIETPQDVSTATAITRYKLCEGVGAMYAWELQIKCSEANDYGFSTEDGDVYEIGCARPGEYRIKFNAAIPNVVGVSGRPPVRESLTRTVTN